MCFLRSVRALAATYFATALLLLHAEGFLYPSSPTIMATRSRPTRYYSRNMAVSMSYADKLREARAAKEAAARARGAPPPPPTSAPTPPPAAPAGPALTATGAAASGGGVDPRSKAIPADSEPPFSGSVLDAIKSAITILSARLQREKPMTREEFERFESAVAIIVEDALPRQELPMSSALIDDGEVSASPRAAPASSTVDEYETEGPAWDPKGGYGLPSGVRNSYIIEDMGKMNPEEYQEALRRKVIARAQSARKTGAYGNIVAKDYLSFLGKNPKVGDEEFESQKKFVQEKHQEDFGKY